MDQVKKKKDTAEVKARHFTFETTWKAASVPKLLRIRAPSASTTNRHVTVIFSLRTSAGLSRRRDAKMCVVEYSQFIATLIQHTAFFSSTVGLMPRRRWCGLWRVRAPGIQTGDDFGEPNAYRCVRICTLQERGESYKEKVTI